MSELSEISAISEAARHVGLDSGRIELIRQGSHGIYRLPGNVVARAGSSDKAEAAEHEVAVAGWLCQHGIDCVQPVAGCSQPTIIGRYAITWWENVGPHRPATPAELGGVLQVLHRLPRPDGLLSTLDPFSIYPIDRKVLDWLSEADQTWLADHLADLRHRWQTQVGSGPNTESWTVVHGDAWQGNLGALTSGTLVLFDLEHLSVGPPEWDLTPIAVDHTDFDRIDSASYQSFVDAYGGYDVTISPVYRLHADLHEFRWLNFALKRASQHPPTVPEVLYRLACVQGQHQRPWTWTAL